MKESNQPTSASLLSNGNYIVVWESLNNGSNNSIIFGQIISPNMNKEGLPFQISNRNNHS